MSVTIYASAINELQGSISKALTMTADWIRGDMVDKEVIPMDTGTLQNSFFVDTTAIGRGKAYVIANTPYARRLYYHPEYHFHRDKNRNAGGRYFDPWMRNGRYAAQVQRAYAEFVKRCCNV